MKWWHLYAECVTCQLFHEEELEAPVRSATLQEVWPAHVGHRVAVCVTAIRLEDEDSADVRARLREQNREAVRALVQHG